MIAHLAAAVVGALLAYLANAALGGLLGETAGWIAGLVVGGVAYVATFVQLKRWQAGV